MICVIAYSYCGYSALADFWNPGSHFNQQVTEVTRWCKDNYLDLKVDKTRETVDLRKKGDVGELIIEGVTVERVIEYNYLGTVLDNKLTFECNTNNIVKKCHQRMFCMFRLIIFLWDQRLCICFIVASLNLFWHIVLSAGLVFWVWRINASWTVLLVQEVKL